MLHNPPSSPMMIISSAADHDDHQIDQPHHHHWLFHSFSAPCRTHFLDFDQLGQFRQMAMTTTTTTFGTMSETTTMAPRSIAFVRSQSESAALNKLAQQRNMLIKPRSLLDEFHVWQNSRKVIGGGGAEGPKGEQGQKQMGTGAGGVKFFAEPLPLQSDSEGEDSLVSPDEEVSPFGSGGEEEELEGHLEIAEEEEEEDDVFRKQASSDPMAPLPCTDFAAFAPVPRRSPSPSASFPPSASFTTLCAAEVAPPPDYITVPPLLTTLDAALPPEPSPLVQLPFQVPLVSVELFHRRPSLDDGMPIEPTTMTIARKDSIAALLEEKSEEQREEAESGSSTTASSRVRPVRRVRFADDCGQCLETVRVMTEPSDYPPKISPAVLRRFRRAAAATAAALNGQSGTPVLPGSTTSNVAAIDEEDSDELEEDGQAGGKKRRSSWKMAFKQPASEYVKFRDNLDRKKVALENVMLKNELGRMVGTIKVANIAYEKRVFVRHTADGWGSYRDSDAKWQSSPSKTFDTFRFDVELPRNEHPSSRIEFCVCFVAGSAPMEVHHWDSNDGKNFVLISPTEYPTPSPSIQFNHNNNKSALGKSPQQMVRSQPRPIERRLELDREDPYRVDWNSPNGWSSTAFGAWKQLSTDGPYWSTSPPFSPLFASEDDENNNNEFNNIGTLLCD